MAPFENLDASTWDHSTYIKYLREREVLEADVAQITRSVIDTRNDRNRLALIERSLGKYSELHKTSA